MNNQRQMPLFTHCEIVHRRHLNMERNVYWTNFHAWFIDALEEFLISVAPDLKEGFSSGNLGIATYDTYIEHKISAFLCENLSLNLNIGEINTRESLMKVSVDFIRGNDKIAEGWQRVRLVNGDNKPLPIPEGIIAKAGTSCIVDGVVNDSAIRKGPSEEPFLHTRKVYLHHTDRNGRTYPMVYLVWFGEVREEFIIHIAPDFQQRFSSGLRILTHDTYLRNYEETASFGDTVSVDIRVGEVKPASARLLFVQKKNGTLLAEGWQTVVFANSEGKLTRIPFGILWNSKKYAVAGLNFLKLLGKI